jgi:serine/threonine protein kinase
MEEIQSLPNIQQQDLEVHDWLGKGSSGVVFQGIWKKNGEQVTVAIKKIKVSGKEVVEEMCKELSAAQVMHCEHICKVYGYCVINNYEQVWVVMEFVDGGDLHNFVMKSKNGGSLPHTLQLSLCIQATKALASLHYSRSPILHKDIKSLNFLIQREKSKLLLTDFGLSRAKSLTTSSFTINTVRWLAPEVIGTNVPLWSEKSDIYSLGMVFYEIVTRTLPYQEDSNLNNIIKKIKTGVLPKFPADCPKEFVSIIQQCLSSKPIKRPSASDLLTLLEMRPPSPTLFRESSSPLNRTCESPPTVVDYDTVHRRCSESLQAAQAIRDIHPEQLLDIFCLVENVLPPDTGERERPEFVVSNLRTILWWLVNHDDPNSLICTKTFLYSTGLATPTVGIFQNLMDIFNAYRDSPNPTIPASFVEVQKR